MIYNMKAMVLSNIFNLGVVSYLEFLLGSKAFTYIKSSSEYIGLKQIEDI